MIVDEDNTKWFSRSPYTFRKTPNNKNYITGHKKAPKNCFKTDSKHLILELGDTNDCKIELSSLLCVETQKHRQKQCFQL